MAKYSLEGIIEAGRRTYAQKGEDFTMSDVAKELGTRASTLYRHVDNKRELYFAILTKEFNIFSQQVDELISNISKPSNKEILQTIGSHILEMSRNNFERFSLMFLTKPPEIGGKYADDQDQPGQFEQQCNPETIDFLNTLVKAYLDQHDLSHHPTGFVTYYIISLVLGAGIVTSPYYDYLSADLLPPTQHQSFHDFIINNSLAWLD